MMKKLQRNKSKKQLKIFYIKIPSVNFSSAGHWPTIIIIMIIIMKLKKCDTFLMQFL